MGIDRRWKIYPNVVQCLTLTLIDCHHKCHSNRILTTTQNKWPISLGGGHDDAGYEHTFANIVPYDDLRFNDTLTQSANLVPLHNPINWLRLRNKRIGTPTLSSSLWFAIPLNCKMFKNSTGYNESIEILAIALAPFFCRNQRICVQVHVQFFK